MANFRVACVFWTLEFQFHWKIIPQLEVTKNCYYNYSLLPRQKSQYLYKGKIFRVKKQRLEVLRYHVSDLQLW